MQATAECQPTQQNLHHDSPSKPQWPGEHQHPPSISLPVNNTDITPSTLDTDQQQQQSSSLADAAAYVQDAASRGMESVKRAATTALQAVTGDQAPQEPHNQDTLAGTGTGTDTTTTTTTATDNKQPSLPSTKTVSFNDEQPATHTKPTPLTTAPVTIITPGPLQTSPTDSKYQEQQQSLPRPVDITTKPKPHSTTPPPSPSAVTTPIVSQERHRKVSVTPLQGPSFKPLPVAGNFGTTPTTTASAAAAPAAVSEYRQQKPEQHEQQEQRLPQKPMQDAQLGQAHGGRESKRRAIAEGREDWISELVENLWDPYILSVLQEMTWEQLPEILATSKPSWIHNIELTKCEFGKKQPDILAVRCFRDDHDIMDDVFMEMDVVWNSQQDVELKLEVLGKNLVSFIPNIVEAQLAKLMTMTVGIEDASLKGTVRLSLRPLFTRVPIVGAVQVSFTEIPEFDFKPTVTGGPLGTALNALLPSIKGWLQNTIRDAAFMPYVLPEHFFYALDPDAHDIIRPVGILHCRVIEAKKVPKMDTFSATDGFVEVFARNSEKHKTQVKQGKRPKWDEVFAMPVHVPEHQKLQFVLWDEDALFPNDEIGRTSIDLSSLAKNEVHDLWLDVVSRDEEERKKARGKGKKGGQGGDDEKGVAAGKRSRAIMKLAAPLAGHSTEGCQLHVRVQWSTWTDAEEALIRDVARHGTRKAAMDSFKMKRSSGQQRGGGSAGGQLDPELEILVWGGLLTVTIKRMNNITVSGLFGRPNVQAVVSVGHEQPKTTSGVKVSHRGHADLTGAPVVLDVDGKLAQHNAHVVVILKETGWFSGDDEVGKIEVPLHQIMEVGLLHKEWEVQDGGSVEIEFKWQGMFQ